MINRKIYFALLFIVFVVLQSCSDKVSSNPSEAYTLWLGQRPPDDVKLINGEYWESSHFTKEFIVYLKLTASSNWFEKLIKQNNLKPQSTFWKKPQKAPLWFQPSSKSNIWISDDEFFDFVVFQEKETGTIFIYNMQL